MGKRILLELIKVENKTKSGIILSEDTFLNSENYAKVLEISEEIDNINIGDKVLFDKDKSMEVKYENRLYYITNLEDVYAKVSDN